MSEQLEIEDFDTAKAVFEKLKDVPADRRKRILAWIAEGFGVIAAPPLPLPTPSLATPQPPGTPAPATGTGVDIKTFVTAKAPKNDAQFATTVAYYYRFEAPVAQKRDSITSEMLQEACRLAGRNRFPTPIVTLNNAKKSGYLDSGARGEFSVNSVGENLVAMTLPGGADAGRAAPKKRVGANKAKKKSGKA
jgi:hypothetical protein